jgi:hypothetical protein
MSLLFANIQVRRPLETLMLILLGNAQECLEEGHSVDPCMCLPDSEAVTAQPVDASKGMHIRCSF